MGFQNFAVSGGFGVGLGGCGVLVSFVFFGGGGHCGLGRGMCLYVSVLMC